MAVAVGHHRGTPLAQEEARLLNHDYVGTEHLLLGLIREGEGVAAQVLVNLGGDLSRVRQQVVQENHDLHGEVERLRALLRRHGIEPGGGTAQAG